MPHTQILFDPIIPFIITYVQIIIYLPKILTTRCQNIVYNVNFRNNQGIGKSTLVKPCTETQIRNCAVEKKRYFKQTKKVPKQLSK